MLQCKENEYFSISRTKNMELAFKPKPDGRLSLFFTNGFTSDHIIVYSNETWAHDGVYYTIPKTLVKALERFIKNNRALVR